MSRERNRKRLLCGYAERSADSKPGAGGKLREIFAAVVVHSETGAHDEVLLGAPSYTDAWSKAPLARRHRRIAHAFCAEHFVVPRNDDADSGRAVRGIECVGGQVVAEILGIKVREEAILFVERTVPIPTQTVGDGEVGFDFEAILREKASLPRTEVAIRFAVEKRAAALIRTERAGKEIFHVAENEIGHIVFAVIDVELGVVVGQAE